MEKIVLLILLALLLLAPMLTSCFTASGNGVLLRPSATRGKIADCGIRIEQ